MMRPLVGLAATATTLLFSAFAAAQGAPPAPAGEPAPEATEGDAKPEAPAAPTAAPPPTAPPQAPAATPYPWGPPGTPAPAAPPPSQPPSQQPPQVDEAPVEPLPPAGPPRWQVFAGVRTAYHTQESFDPFAENNAFPQFSFGASRRLFTSEPFSFAGALTGDVGTRSASARGAPTSLYALRLLLGPEARWHLMPQLYVFARPSAGVLRTVAQLDEGTTGTTLKASAWSLAIDATAGAAFSVIDLRRHAGDLRFWLVADGGYGWAATSDLLLAPEEDTGPKRTAELDLGELALGGPFFRIAAAATF